MRVLTRTMMTYALRENVGLPSGVLLFCLSGECVSWSGDTGEVRRVAVRGSVQLVDCI